MNKKLKKALYLDDIRTPTENLPGYEPWIIARNYTEFKGYITTNGLPDLISFDHDLSEEHMRDYLDQVSKIGWASPSYGLYQEKTGLDCAKLLCAIVEPDIIYYRSKSEHDIFHHYTQKRKFPICVVHSHNPVGTDNIKNFINGFIKHYKIDSVCYEQKFPFIVEEKNKY